MHIAEDSGGQERILRDSMHRIDRMGLRMKATSWDIKENDGWSVLSMSVRQLP